MGSKLITTLKYRHAFTFVGILGGKNQEAVLEKMGRTPKDKVSITKIVQIAESESSMEISYLAGKLRDEVESISDSGTEEEVYEADKNIDPEEYGNISPYVYEDS